MCFTHLSVLYGIVRVQQRCRHLNGKNPVHARELFSCEFLGVSCVRRADKKTRKNCACFRAHFSKFSRVIRFFFNINQFSSENLIEQKQGMLRSGRVFPPLRIQGQNTRPIYANRSSLPLFQMQRIYHVMFIRSSTWSFSFVLRYITHTRYIFFATHNI